ncbi:alpha/beta fold hydrolase [Tomitella gaofuii]|uniref:alpha/beta fold hydrolase n=1 Tax=Tomitella gaofuii TaxID=2760083 RepID=UPI001F19B2BA|nr:alpha/beta fold hydrolase [Tomitella gaofuii]
MATQTRVPSQRTAWARAPWEISSAWTSGWAGYLRSAARRGAGPATVLNDTAVWFRAVTRRRAPGWSTEHTVVRNWPQARLLGFSTGTSAVPTLVLPPQAGHASSIVDYSPEQSQIRTALEAGLDSLYCLDWLPATAETAGSTIEDYIGILDDAVGRLGGRVNLIGDCQGGWLASIYAALRPGAVQSLSVGGAPIDFHAGRSAIREWMKSTGAGDPMRPYRAMVALGRGRYRGRNQLLAFKMLEPAGEAERVMDLWAHIDDPAHVERFNDFTDWFEWTQDIAGPFYLWIVEHLFVRNELVAGTLTVGGERVDLGRITAPLLILAGTRDHITPAAQAWALDTHAATSPEQARRESVDAGHLGLFMGHTALREHWLPGLRAVAALPRP